MCVCVCVCVRERERERERGTERALFLERLPFSGHLRLIRWSVVLQEAGALRIQYKRSRGNPPCHKVWTVVNVQRPKSCSQLHVTPSSRLYVYERDRARERERERESDREREREGESVLSMPATYRAVAIQQLQSAKI
jgi:hypothetical protein